METLTKHAPGMSAAEYEVELGLQPSFVELLPEQVAAARLAHDADSDTYRVRVGFASCAIDAHNALLPIVSGGNRKHTQHVAKTCAEDVAHSRLAKYGPVRLLGGVILATGDHRVIKSVLHFPAHALYICEDNCVIKFAHNPIVGPSCHFVSVIAETGEYEAHTYAGLRDKYREPPKSLMDVPKYRSSDNWAVC